MMPSDTSKIRDLFDQESTHEKEGQELLREEDNDVSEPVPANLYEMSFEEALAMTPALVDSETGVMNWYILNTRFMPAVIRKMAGEAEVSFAVIARVAILHGFSIFRHDHTDLIVMMHQFDNASVEEINGMYHKHLTQKVGIGRDVKRIPVSIEKQTMREMGEMAALVGTTRAHLAGACLMLSLLTSEGLGKQARKKIEEQIADFNMSLKLFETCAITLTNPQ